MEFSPKIITHPSPNGTDDLDYLSGCQEAKPLHSYDNQKLA